MTVDQTRKSDLLPGAELGAAPELQVTRKVGSRRIELAIFPDNDALPLSEQDLWTLVITEFLPELQKYADLERLEGITRVFQEALSKETNETLVERSKKPLRPIGGRGKRNPVLQVRVPLPMVNQVKALIDRYYLEQKET